MTEELKAPILKIEGDALLPKRDATLTFKTETLAHSGQLLRPLHEDDVALTKESRPYNFENPEFMHPISLAQTLIRCMREYGGVGLSAIQIGMPIRVFSIGFEKENQVFFNPEIIATGVELAKMKEGCISFPFCAVIVERPTHIRARWQNEEGEVKEGDFSGYTARIFQHELDHLNGITIRDKISKLTWKLTKQRAAGLYKRVVREQKKMKQHAKG